MYNYFTSQIMAVDIFLVLAIALLAITIILYALLAEMAAKRRNKGLVDIKRNVYQLVLSGAKLSANVCAPFAEKTTEQQFLDIETNRDSVFFNKAEQDAFSSCFKAPERIKEIEKTARGARNKWRKIEAMLSLSYLDDKSAPGIFKKALSSRDDDIRYFAIIALGQTKNERSAAILVDLIKKDDFPKRKIVSILEGFPSDITSVYAATLLKDKRSEVRFWALRLLSLLNPGKHLKEIFELFADSNDEVRAAACGCAGNSKNSSAAEKLYEALKDKSWIVRSAAVNALSTLEGDACIKHTIGLLRDSSLTVLSSVKESIVNHIDAARPYMESIFSGDDEMSKVICTEAIEEAARKRIKT